MDKNGVLQLLRRKQGDRTQVELAKELGISTAYLSDIFNGNREPSAAILDYLELKRQTFYTRKAIQ